MEAKGILYIATGEEFVEEAKKSAESVRCVMPNMDICLISDIDVNDDIIDQNIQIEDPYYGFFDQIKYMTRTPYNKTILLDTDTYVCDDISDLFLLLENFDIAAAHNHDRESKDFAAIPKSFPEYNTGVLAYSNTPKIREFLKYWEKIYKSETSLYSQNQPSFRKALFNSDLKIATLPPEYNCMVRYPGHAIGTVKIFHGRLIDINTPGANKHVEMETAVQKINAQDNHRVYTTLGGITVYSDELDSRINQFRWVCQRFGYWCAIKKTIKWFKSNSRINFKK